MSTPQANTVTQDNMKGTRKSGWVSSALTAVSGVAIAILIGVPLGKLIHQILPSYSSVYYSSIGYCAQGLCFLIPGIFGIIASSTKRQQMYLTALILGSVGLGTFFFSLIWLWGIPYLYLLLNGYHGYAGGLIFMWILGCITMLIMTINMGMLRRSVMAPGVVIHQPGMGYPMVVNASGYPTQAVITTNQAYPGQMAPMAGYGYDQPPAQMGAYGYQPPPNNAQPPPAYAEKAAI